MKKLKIGDYIEYTTAEGDKIIRKINLDDLKWSIEDEKGFNLVHIQKKT